MLGCILYITHMYEDKLSALPASPCSIMNSMNSMPVIINTAAVVDPAKRSLDDGGGGGGKGRKRLRKLQNMFSLFFYRYIVVMCYM